MTAVLCQILIPSRYSIIIIVVVVVLFFQKHDAKWWHVDCSILDETDWFFLLDGMYFVLAVVVVNNFIT